MIDKEYKPIAENKKLNKGEWAEFYVFLKLLGEGKLYSANKLLKKNLSNYLDIMRIIRQEYASELHYVLDREKEEVNIRVGENIITTIPMIEFNKHADILFKGIVNLSGNSVSAPSQIYSFANMIYVSKPKAPSVESFKKLFGGKNDIFIEVRDSQTSIVSLMGFSIKSKFGQNPTLFNAGTSSQMYYKLNNMTDEKMKEFNAICDGEKRGWSECVNYIKANNIELELIDAQYDNFKNNLMLVRESMSKIYGWIVKDRLIDSCYGKSHNIRETVERLIEANPLKVGNPAIYYEKAMKDFLIAGFTGMTAGRAWDGKEQVSGGYIVVMEDGEVLCYHSNDRESFRDYLYDNTYFDYVSAKKYNWSYIVSDGTDYYLALNVSIRFNKETR